MMHIIFSIAIFLSLSVVGFAWFRFLPLSLDHLLIAAVLSTCLIIYNSHKNKEKNHGRFSGVATIIVFAGVIFGFYKMTTLVPAPPGADMATHTYTARVILEKNGYPKTMKPTVPISSFGFAPFGLPVLTALTARYSGLELHTASLYVTAVVYIFLFLGIYLFLVSFFSPLVSSIVAVWIFVIERDFVRYISWGGNPTPLSIAFLLFGIICTIRCIRYNVKLQKLALVPAVFFAASFYTHQTSMAFSCYCMVPFLGILFFQKNYTAVKNILYIFIWILILLIPFYFSISGLSVLTQKHLAGALNADHFAIEKGFPHVITSSLHFLTSRMGERTLPLFLIGIYLVAHGGGVSLTVITVSTVVLIILLINSKYPILPFSALFYPDRIVTTYHIVIAYSLGVVLSKLEESFLKAKKKLSLMKIIALSLVVGTFLWYFLSNVAYIFQEVLYPSVTSQTSVTPNDLTVMQWIDKNLPKEAVIANNYGDAGVWIPAIINRTVNWNDSHGHYLGELEEAQKLLTPRYVFIGVKPVYASIKYTKGNMDTHKYKLLFQSGSAQVYEILSPAHDGEQR